MNTRSPSGKAAAAVAGCLVGAAAGFLLTEGVAALFTLVLGRAPDLKGAGVLLGAFVAVPIGCAVLGGVVAVRRAGRALGPWKGGG
ncbi:hypothetical protein [Streptomyces sp. NPDC003077]|uniref:hypothetical protein n=1 Tax=Streptomyces sp. NPDC003077 TaxID=3154443 RepID=UPI0033AD94C3